MGSVVITWNRTTVCASSKRQSLLETCQGSAGAVIYSAGTHLLTPHPTVPGSFPFLHHSSYLLMLAVAWEPDTGIDPVRNVGRVWAERRKGPALTLGCKSERHHTRLPSNAKTPGHKGSLPVQLQPGRDWAAPRQPHLPGTGHMAPGALFARSNADASSHGKRLALRHPLLLHSLCCQGPSPNMNGFSPDLPQTQPPSAPRQDQSRKPWLQTRRGSCAPRTR